MENEHLVLRTDIIGGRADDLVVLALLDDMGAPARERRRLLGPDRSRDVHISCHFVLPSRAFAATLLA